MGLVDVFVGSIEGLLFSLKTFGQAAGQEISSSS